MLEIFLFSFGIIFAPGPLNFLSLNQGVNKRFGKMIGFFAGVGGATLVLFLLLGYTGERFISMDYLIYISCIGSSYILYLAYKVFKSSIDFDDQANARLLTFKEGFFMQLFNPKAPLVALPIATISFPANDITGIKIAMMSLIISFMAGMAPCSYGFFGERFSQIIMNKRILKVFNKLMALLLVYVAFSIFRDHVYLVLLGVNPY